MVRWPSGKARVCKTLIRGFDSHPHLSSFYILCISCILSRYILVIIILSWALLSVKIEIRT